MARSNAQQRAATQSQRRKLRQSLSPLAFRNKRHNNSFVPSANTGVSVRTLVGISVHPIVVVVSVTILLIRHLARAPVNNTGQSRLRTETIRSGMTRAPGRLPVRLV